MQAVIVFLRLVTPLTLARCQLVLVLVILLLCATLILVLERDDMMTTAVGHTLQIVHLLLLRDGPGRLLVLRLKVLRARALLAARTIKG